MLKIANKIYVFLKDKLNKKEFIINLLIVAIVLFICFYNFPYVIYRPGGTISLSNRIYLNDKKIKNGDYNMAYVSVVNGNALNMLLAIINSDWDIKKTSDITYKDTDFETTLEIEKLDLKNSINIAKYIAYTKAGKKASLSESKIIVSMVDEKAKTNLKPLDEIVKINGKEFIDTLEMKKYINTLEVNEKVSIDVINNGKKYKRYANIIKINNNKLLGVVILNNFELETDPKIEIKSKDSEAGSSGGMMLTLAIYDALIKEDLTKGNKIAGTGTIEIDGKIGEIAGIKYKLLGAKKEKVDIFFVSKKNYKEAKMIYDKYNLKFKLIMVESIDDVIEYLNNLK